MRFLLWSMLKKNNEGEVIRNFEPKHLAHIAQVAEEAGVDTILLYEVPATPTDNKWNYLKESLHGNGWKGFVRALYHQDWAVIYLSKAEIECINVTRFDDSDETKDFDFLDTSGRVSVTIQHCTDQEDFLLSPTVTFFHSKPQQNSALRCETIDSILKSVKLEEGQQHILAGNFIDNTIEGQVFKTILIPLGYDTAFSDYLTMPAAAPKWQADSIFVKNMEVKKQLDAEQLFAGTSSFEHIPILVELA